VGCFSRGDALQEKASPYYLHSQSKSADLIGTKLNVEVFLQAETTEKSVVCFFIILPLLLQYCLMHPLCMS